MSTYPTFDLSRLEVDAAAGRLAQINDPRWVARED
jgi:hypothetical protein